MWEPRCLTTLWTLFDAVVLYNVAKNVVSQYPEGHDVTGHVRSIVLGRVARKGRYVESIGESSRWDDTGLEEEPMGMLTGFILRASELAGCIRGGGFRDQASL
jgi:hypothetical protein